MNKILINIIIGAAFLLSILCYNHFALATNDIHEITIQGNTRIESSTVQNYLGLKIGDPYNELRKNEAIKRLYSTSFFEKIDIKFLRGTLIIVVEETPFVSKIEFKGNSKVKSSILLKELMTKSGESLSKANISSDIEKIKEIYKRAGRFSTIVASSIEIQENNRVKIIFDVVEGPKTGIKHIYFIGNKNYRNKELQAVILTKESRWFRFGADDTYDPDRIEYDKELLKSFYQSIGFADFQVISAISELSNNREYFTLTYVIEEGEKYHFGNINIDNKLPNINIDELQKLLNIKEKQIFDTRQLEAISENITKNLANRGYPQVNVNIDTRNDAITKLVDVTFVIDKADKVYVNNINVIGNLKTEDVVVRRELRIEEGDIFNRSYIEKGERNIRNLDFFEKISTRIVPTTKRDRYDVNIEVAEKSTSSLGLDVGYDSSSGLFSRVAFLERNLVGTGKSLHADVRFAKSTTNTRFGLSEPYFLGKDLSLGGDIFIDRKGKGGGYEKNEKNYILDTYGSTIALGYEIGEDLTHNVQYVIKTDNLKVPPAQAATSRFLIEQAGKFITSSISHDITYDRVDSRVVPKNGYLLKGLQEYAGVGGNNKYLKHDVSIKYFKSFINNNITLKLSGSAGDIRGTGGKVIRIPDRFNLGDYSFRGFESGGIGPRDKTTKEGLGGQEYYSLTTELQFPVGLPEEFNVSGSVFMDMGSVWNISLNSKSNYSKEDFYNDQSMRISVGCGVTWITRIAPIRLDWGWAIKNKKYDKKQHFHFKLAAQL